MKKLSCLLVIMLICGFSFVRSDKTTIRNENINEIKTLHTYSESRFEDIYDLVIISPAVFLQELKPLIEHKNKYGIQTVLKTTEEIYHEYDGNDKPEQIKYFIKDAIETWDIKYVMLVGGLKHYIWNNARDTKNYGDEYWHVPVRYSNLVEPSMYKYYEPGFVSDLYYADVYDDKGNFSSWDSDYNGVYGEWNNRDWSSGKDTLDLYPDICVGRLACRNKYEVKIVVDKIITYEAQSHGQDWFTKIILAGGDNFVDDKHNYFEGELMCDYIYDNYMSDYTPIKLYASNLNTDLHYIPTPKNFIREFSLGCGFVYIGGHGSPGRIWAYWPDGSKEIKTIVDIVHLPQLTNGNKLPIALFGGCCNAQINISVLYPYLKKTIEMAGYWDILEMSCPKSLSWGFASKKGGGSIAAIGYDGLAYVSNQIIDKDLDGNGINEPDWVEERHGFLIQSFFKGIDDGIELLGDVWARAITRYLDTFPDMNHWLDTKNLEVWILLGDPSLKIGGYS